MSEPVSAIQGRAASGNAKGLAIGLTDAGPQGMVTLRGDLSSPALAAAVQEAVGVSVPGTREANFAGGRGAVWMSPDELLLRLPYGDAPAATAAIGKALDGEHHLALDVSDARTVIRLTGEDVPEVLAKCAPVDLAPGAFPVGSARRTHMGQIAVAFWRIAETEWEIVALRSYGHHLYDWLAASAKPGGKVGVF